MERGIFIFAFVVFILLISGTMFSSIGNKENKIALLGCGTLGSSSESNNLPREVDAKYLYESVPVINWKFTVDSSGLALNIPDMTIEGQTVKRVPSDFKLTKHEKSTEHCQYYFFPYVREAKMFSYTFPLADARVINSKPTCLYNPQQFVSDSASINSLGGVPLSLSAYAALLGGMQGEAIFLGDLCSGYVEAAPSVPADCVNGRISCDMKSYCNQIIQCDIEVVHGESAFYGVGYDKNSAGRVVVLEDNLGLPIFRADAGQPILQSDFDQVTAMRAENFINSCSVKYREESEQVCGNEEIEGDEECDDGNKENGDGCSSECRNENLLCNGVISPTTSSQSIRGTTNVDIKVDVKSASPLKKDYSFGGKTSVNIEANNLMDNEIPKTVRYVLTVEGNSVIAGAVYTESMLKIARNNPQFWNLLNSASGQGIIGVGIEYDLQSDGLTISKVYSLDTNVDDFVNANKNLGQSNWISFVTEVEIFHIKGSAGKAVITVPTQVTQISFSKRV